MCASFGPKRERHAARLRSPLDQALAKCRLLVLPMLLRKRGGPHAKTMTASHLSHSVGANLKLTLHSSASPSATKYNPSTATKLISIFLRSVDSSTASVSPRSGARLALSMMRPLHHRKHRPTAVKAAEGAGKLAPMKEISSHEQTGRRPP